MLRVDEDYLDAVRVDVGVVGHEQIPDEVVQFRGHLDPGRPAPDNHEGQLGVGDLAPRQRYLLVALDDPVDDRLAGADPPYAYAVLLHAGYAEVGRLGPQREHEMLVGELLAARHHAPPLQIHAVQGSTPEAGAEPDQGPAQGLSDVLGRHVAADNAGQHRPEREVVLPRDEHDPDVVAVPG